MTSKVWNDAQHEGRTLAAFDESLDRLGLDYVDLYLVHWPVERHYKDTWLDIESICQSGRARAIGVSNFMPHHLDDLLSACKILPSVNQVEFHPLLVQPDLMKVCRDHDIQVVAWSPLMKGNVSKQQTIVDLADKYGKTPAQIVLRWDLQHEVVAIPKSKHYERIAENGDIFDFDSYANPDDLERGAGVPGFDAVVHFAAIPRILIRSDNETYRVNVMGTYNVLEAAVKLGIRKIVFASSETVYGICFADGEKKPDYIPVDEQHPTIPHDSYGASKVANEVTAQCFQARSGFDIYGIRINNVIEPHEYEERFPDFLANPGLRRRNIFAYIDARDLGQMVETAFTNKIGFK